MNSSIATTKAIVSKLETELETLKSQFALEKTENDELLEKVCCDYEESEIVFREKLQIVQSRLDKSARILDEVVDKRFKTRESKQREMKDIEEMISATRLNIQKVNEETDIILNRIEREIEAQITHLLIV